MGSVIVALSTPPAKAALAVIRMTGEGSRKIGDKVFIAKSKKLLKSVPGYTGLYGDFICDGEICDEGIALAFSEPKSYTGEEMVEFYCHGNPEIAQKIIEAAIKAGAKPAAHGEFTRRAFENGKLDLSEAEAVAELIEAEGEGARRAALGRRNGLLSKRINEVLDILSYLTAELSVWSDYPEETDAPDMTKEKLIDKLSQAKEILDELAKTHKCGKYIQKGISIAIVGKPNVGKSTLLNALVGENKAIVTDIAGTTRDIVEAQTVIGTIPVRILDTAGIRETNDTIEKIGVDRAKQALENCDLAIFLFDKSEKITNEEINIYEEVKKGPHIIVMNKNDLSNNENTYFKEYLEISAKENIGIDILENKILEKLGISLYQDNALIASERQYDCTVRAIKAIDEALEATKEGQTFDAVGILIDEALEALGDLLGKNASELTLEQVFSHFCVGK